MKKKISYLALLLACYLGVHNGYLAVFETGNTDPLEVFPYPASLFPATDRLALSRGIPIESPLEYQILLEDFLS